MNGLEKELSGRLDIIRVDIHTRDGRVLANQMGFEYTPTFILFAADGAELWRQVGGLDVERVRRSVGE